MRSFYPRIKPYATHELVVDSVHTLYVEEAGNPRGTPVLFVHGEPGGGCTENDRRFFDPEKYRIILFDQRGSGRSKPHAELEANHTRCLVDDMEKIRELMGVEQWVLFGGSWGSTLSLLYAQAYPEKVLAMILRGIFLCREQDIQWFYQDGACHVFPDYWQSFLAENEILEGMGALKDIPGVIIHGRYDMVCPVSQAFDLHRAWPGSRLKVIRDAVHASSEPSTLAALVQATDDLLSTLGNVS